MEVGKNAVAIAYTYKEMGINNLAVLRWAKVQLGLPPYLTSITLPFTSHLLLVTSSQNAIGGINIIFSSPIIIYSVYLPQHILMDFPHVTSLASLPFLTSFVKIQ